MPQSAAGASLTALTMLRRYFVHLQIAFPNLDTLNGF